MKEADVLRVCRSYLNFLQARGKLTYRRIHVAPIMRGGGKNPIRFQRNMDMAGMADLLIFLKTNPPRVIHVECKSSFGKTDDIQKKWREELKRVGHHDYFLVRGIEDLRGVLRLFSIEDGFKEVKQEIIPK